MKFNSVLRLLVFNCLLTKSEKFKSVAFAHNIALKLFSKSPVFTRFASCFLYHLGLGKRMHQGQHLRDNLQGAITHTWPRQKQGGIPPILDFLPVLDHNQASSFLPENQPQSPNARAKPVKYLLLVWMFAAANVYRCTSRTRLQARARDSYRGSIPALNIFLIFTLMGIRYASIHGNPVRAEIVSNPVDYLYSSARDYAGEKGW